MMNKHFLRKFSTRGAYVGILSFFVIALFLSINTTHAEKYPGKTSPVNVSRNVNDILSKATKNKPTNTIFPKPASQLTAAPMACAAPSCSLNGIGLLAWLGDSDSQFVDPDNGDDEDGDDFIGFRNFGSTAVNISGWQLFTDQKSAQTSTSTPAVTFPSGTIIQPGGFFVVVAEWNDAGTGDNGTLPTNYFDANFNTGGEGLFEETSNNEAYAILRNPTTNQYITIHQQGSGSSGATSPFSGATKVCNLNVTNFVPNDFDGCQMVYFNDSSCGYASVSKNGSDCTLTQTIFTQISTCQAGSTQPTLSQTSISNTCPAAQVNLTSITASNTPSSTTLTFHSGTPATLANELSNTAITASGTYYAAFKGLGNNCYSPTRAVTVTITACSAGTIDCSKTQIYPAPVAGTAAQLSLLVTINVTTAGTFIPTVSGSGMSLAMTGFTITATTTGVQQFHIPVKYDGTTLGIMSFGASPATPSCTADLTVTPKSVISTVWTLDNCTPVQVGPALK